MSNKMELTKNGLENRQAWESAGYILPKFDREEVVKKTKKIHSGYILAPAIYSVHFRLTLCSSF